jgi:hypothetical protein
MKLIGDENTIVIDSAHAGDNFIVVVDTVQANVNNAALGTTEATRYEETHGYVQSELLTVWRTVNVERDSMVAANAQPYDPNKTPEQNRTEGRPDMATTGITTGGIGDFDPPLPDISFLQNDFMLKKACMEAKLVDDTHNSHRNLPFIETLDPSNDPQTFVTLEVFRDVQSESDFMTRYVVGANNLTWGNTGYAFDTGVTHIYYGRILTLITATPQRIGDLRADMPIPSEYDDNDTVQFVANHDARLVAHEILHQLGLSHGDGGIMDYFTYLFLDDSKCELTGEQIKKIQSNVI